MLAGNAAATGASAAGYTASCGLCGPAEPRVGPAELAEPALSGRLLRPSLLRSSTLGGRRCTCSSPANGTYPSWLHLNLPAAVAASARHVGAS